MEDRSQFMNSKVQDSAISLTFIPKVFLWMFSALAVSAIAAFSFGTNLERLSLLFNPGGGLSLFGIITMIAPFIMVVFFNRASKKLSFKGLAVYFITYALIMCISLSFIFGIYTASAIYQTLGITAGMFLMMAIVGFTTKTDLTKLDSILMMALIGIIIASVVNFFIGSSMMDYIISFVGVLVFTGLIAYDVQKLKRIGAGIMNENIEEENVNKLAIFGALRLYLDFINLFLFLLRLFRRS